MASDASSASLSSSNPGTNNTSSKTSGSATALSATFLGVSKANSSQVVVQIATYGAPSNLRVSNGVVQITAPNVSGNQNTINYVMVQQSLSITQNWSFDLQVSTPGGNGGGTYTFAKGVGSEGRASILKSMSKND